MTALAALRDNTVWLETRNYDVVSLNDKLTRHIPELAATIQQGVPACADRSRQGFYDVKLRHGWCYVNVHDETRTVYLVAFARIRTELYQ